MYPDDKARTAEELLESPAALFDTQQQERDHFSIPESSNTGLNSNLTNLQDSVDSTLPKSSSCLTCQVSSQAMNDQADLCPQTPETNKVMYSSKGVSRHGKSPVKCLNGTEQSSGERSDERPDDGEMEPSAPSTSGSNGNLLAEAPKDETHKLSVKELEKEEPLLQENPDRYVILPIQYSDIWAYYKKAQGNICLYGVNGTVNYLKPLTICL